jgi:short-subunit dehydrogenase
MKVSEISAVITGAAGGIGAPLARGLIQQGARVLLVGRDATRLERLATELASLGEQGDGRSRGDRSRVDAISVDLTTAAGRQAVCTAARKRSANVLIHGAAIPGFGSFADLGDDRLGSLLQTNLFAPIALTRDLLAQLKSAPQAAVLAVGSMVGEIGLPGYAAYGASKAGLKTFCEALRRELAGTRVRVQYVAARATRTGFNDQRVERYNQMTATRVDPPERVADAIIAMLRSGQSIKHLGMPERLFVRLNATVPTWIDGGFARHREALAQCVGLEEQSNPLAPSNPIEQGSHW